MPKTVPGQRFNSAESGSYQKAAVTVWDRPEEGSMKELVQLVDETDPVHRDSVVSEFLSSREGAHPRLYLGKSQSGAVSLGLNDQDGRERLIVQVGPEGDLELRFLDEDGEIIARFPTASSE